MRHWGPQLKPASIAGIAGFLGYLMNCLQGESTAKSREGSRSNPKAARSGLARMSGSDAHSARKSLFSQKSTNSYGSVNWNRLRVLGEL